MASINLGGFYLSGNRQVASGLASGLDTETIVKTLVDLKSAPQKLLQDTIDVNTKKIGALSELEQKLDSFRTALNVLRNPPGVQNDSSNIFQYRLATLTSSTSDAASNFMEVTAAPGANLGSTKLTVTQLAKEKTTVYSTSFASRTAANPGVITAGTITLTSTNHSAVNISISAGDSLNNVASKINAKENETGVAAEIVQVASNDYRLILKSNKTGLDNSFTLSDPSGAFAALTVDAVNSQTAQNATFTVNGISISRNENTVTDAVENVTLKLKALTSGATLTLQSSADTTTVKSGIINFVNAYNDLKLFYAKQTELDESTGSPKETAVLATNNTLSTVMNGVDNEITRFVNGLDEDALKSLGELGVTFTDYEGNDENPATRNILTVDETKLSSVLSSSFDQVRRVFEFSYSSSNSNLIVSKRTNALAETSFDLVIDSAADTAYAYERGTATLIAQLDYSESGGSITLTGRDDTNLEGLTLVYASTTSATIEVDISQGVADRLYNFIDGSLTQDTGLIAADVNSLTDNNTDSNEEIASLGDEIERYRQEILDRFSRLETIISSVNQLLASLQANTDAANKS